MTDSLTCPACKGACHPVFTFPAWRCEACGFTFDSVVPLYKSNGEKDPDPATGEIIGRYEKLPIDHPSVPENLRQTVKAAGGDFILRQVRR